MTRFFLAFIVILHSCGALQAQEIVFIGSYNKNRKTPGIFVYRQDTATGELDKITDASIFHPSYLTIAPDGRHLYACTETLTKGAGSVSAFDFDASKGTLTFVNTQPSGGENPVYLSVNNNGKWLVNANYTDGSLSVFPLQEDGPIGRVRQVIPFSGSSIDKERQQGPHIHACVFSPDQQYLFLPDLGTDRIRCLPFSSAAAEPITIPQERTTFTTPGSGPRHFIFHPNGRYAYCIEELSGTVSTYKYTNGSLDSIQRIPAHHPAPPKNFSSADIHVSPDGKFLYASNRSNDNNIAIFSINQPDGRLTPIGYQSTLGDHPRNFVITPSGKFLLVANQISGNVVVFLRNAETGMLSNTGYSIKIRGASCLQILPAH